MKLVFYGGGDRVDNKELDATLVELIGKKTPNFTYIPASAYGSEFDFNHFVEQYQALVPAGFIHFPIDINYSKTFLHAVLESDMIHLSGGNTYYFLRNLKEKGLLPKFKQFVKRGGVLSGLSAGAILMTPNISTAGFPKFDRDENEVELKDFNSMNLVGFEFFPHYYNSNRYDIDLIQHSKKTKNPIIACPDGAGVVVDGKDVHFVKKAYLFEKGKKYRIN